MFQGIIGSFMVNRKHNGTSLALRWLWSDILFDLGYPLRRWRRLRAAKKVGKR